MQIWTGLLVALAVLALGVGRLSGRFQFGSVASDRFSGTIYVALGIAIIAGTVLAEVGRPVDSQFHWVWHLDDYRYGKPPEYHTR